MFSWKKRRQIISSICICTQPLSVNNWNVNLNHVISWSFLFQLSIRVAEIIFREEFGLASLSICVSAKSFNLANLEPQFSRLRPADNVSQCELASRSVCKSVTNTWNTLLSVFRMMHSVILNAALILSTAVLVLSNHIPLQNVLTNQIRVHYSE